jgi:AAA15 family ATPase/GTPase
MIVSFTVENFLSIRDRLKIDFVADTIKEYKDNQFPPFLNSKDQLLKSLAIYGSNNSGKSNVIKAISFAKNFVLHSSKESHSSQVIPIQPFLLSSTTKEKPSLFEVVFYMDNRRYRYGFSVTPKYIDSEWLFVTEKRKEENLFVRFRQDYNFQKSFKEVIKGKFELYTEVTRQNTLFLSVLAQFNSPLCMQIANWFSQIFIIHDSDHLGIVDYTASLMTTGDYKQLINEFIIKSDLGIENVEEQQINQPTLKDNFHELVLSIARENSMLFKILTYHSEYNADGKISNRIFFDLLKNESFGTQRFFGIIGPVFESLKNKRIIFIDELDAHLHSLLFERVISLFNSTKFNPNGAQLVFTAHNSQPLKKGLRRDQMLFMQKDEKGSSKIFALHAEKPEVRHDASFEKDYLLGNYGAIPKLNQQMNLFDNDLEN